MTRRKAPGTVEKLADYISQAGGFHAHRYVIRGNRKRYGWGLVFADETHRCGTEDCFVMRLKNVERDTNASLTGGEV